MGRGRRGGTTTSIRKAERNPKRYRTKIFWQPNLVRGTEETEQHVQLFQAVTTGGNTVSVGTTINSLRTKPRLGPSNK